MGQEKTDLRVIRTRRAIREAFCSMIMEMDYSDITIKELTRRAMINRNTFYLHYESMDALLRELQEEIAGEFPDAFFEELDGGIQLEEEALPDPDFPPGEMYIMGEYCHDMLGRYIVLYYGSFAALLPEEDEEGWKDELFATVAHEFTHHMEETAGLHALDDKDAEFLRQAREIYGDT